MRYSLRLASIARLFFLFCLFSMSALVQAQNASTIQIDRKTEILIRESEPKALQLATQDLANDMKKVFGVAPRIVHTRSNNTTTLAIGGAVPVPEKEMEAPESFSITVVREKGAASPQIVLRGGDMRGTIYAIYTFAQEVLGVDPMYYWTDKQPAARVRIPLPADYHRSDPGPLCRFRGFFINDEDLLSGWAPGKPAEHSGISLDVWNHLFETILRLKGNMVAPGTWIFPDDGQIKLVGERGLLLSQHHATPLGVNVARWPQGVPYDYTNHPEIIRRAWRNAVNTYDPSQEVLWEVGLRGLSDTPYSSSDPSVRNNDAALGERISQAIRDQMSIVREKHPNALFVTDLWSEGNRLMQKGVLTIPPEVMTVWSDSGYGKLHDNGKLRKGQGAYLHIAMMNDQANQLTEMTPLDRLLAETKRLEDAGATSFYLVNTSDVRPVAMSARAVMEAAWGSLKAGQAKEYYQKWAKLEFGPAAAKEIAAIYEQYFKAPAHHPDQNEYGDHLYQTVARKMLLYSEVNNMPTYVLPDQAPKWQTPHLMGLEDRHRWLMEEADRKIVACGEAQQRWQAVYQRAQQAAHLVEPSRRAFYQSHILTMISINMEGNSMLLHVSRAVKAKDAGNTTKAVAEIELARSALERVKVAEKLAEYGKWKNWYHGDWFAGIDRTRSALAHYEAALKDPQTPIAAPFKWNDWEGYYHILYYEGDRTVDLSENSQDSTRARSCSFLASGQLC